MSWHFSSTVLSQTGGCWCNGYSRVLLSRSVNRHNLSMAWFLISNHKNARSLGLDNPPPKNIPLGNKPRCIWSSEHKNRSSRHPGPGQGCLPRPGGAAGKPCAPTSPQGAAYTFQTHWRNPDVLLTSQRSNLTSAPAPLTSGLWAGFCPCLPLTLSAHHPSSWGWVPGLPFRSIHSHPAEILGDSVCTFQPSQASAPGADFFSCFHTYRSF